ncbi:MAG: DUF3047 domain-containing protein [Desulfobacteraceae bacterium]|nr:DUF3047 domain-containing protein [Desulfobacteraceae bacterium]
MAILFLFLTAGLCFFPAMAAIGDEQEILWAGEFSQQKLDNWLPKKFISETRYALATIDGEMALKAVSRKSASGLIKKIRVDLEKYPFLNWRWRIENRLTGTFDEKQKPGDDYAARIYVVVSGGIAIWKTKALNYVWARNSPKGDTWPNAFAGNNAMMKALRSSEAPVSVWLREKRNIREDFKTLFGKEIRFIDAVVLMTDTDNTQKEVTAHYGDIYFTTR